MTADFANRGYELDCGGGPRVYELVDGKATSADTMDPQVHLDDVWIDDLTGDGQLEAVARLSCTVGASTHFSYLFAYQEGPAGSIVRAGTGLTANRGVIEREAPDRYGVQVPRPEPGDPRCCPSYYGFQTWALDFDTTWVFQQEGPELLVAAEDIDPAPWSTG